MKNCYIFGDENTYNIPNIQEKLHTEHTYGTWQMENGYADDHHNWTLNTLSIRTPQMQTLKWIFTNLQIYKFNFKTMLMRELFCSLCRSHFPFPLL